MGFSKGTADIEFEKWEDAERALNTFNSKLHSFNFLDSDVDGQIMKIQFSNVQKKQRRVFRNTLGRKRRYNSFNRNQNRNN